MGAEIERLVNAAGVKPRGSFQAKGMMLSMMLRQTHRPQRQRIGLTAPAIGERKPVSRRQSYGVHEGFAHPILRRLPRPAERPPQGAHSILGRKSVKFPTLGCRC